MEFLHLLKCMLHPFRGNMRIVNAVLILFYNSRDLVFLVKQNVIHCKVARSIGLLHKVPNLDSVTHAYFSTIGLYLSNQNFKQSRFTNPVFAYESYFFTLRYSDGQVLKKPSVIV